MLAVDEPLLVALDHQRSGRYAEAEALYDALLAREPRHGHALYLAGLLHLRLGRNVQAVQRLQVAVRVQPEHVGAWTNLARAHLALGEAGDALAAAERGLALDPSVAHLHFLRGTACNAIGQPAQAVAPLRRAIALASDLAPAHLNLANAYADLDRFDEAERGCRAAIALDPQLLEAHASLGFVLTSRGRLREAVAACDAAIARQPDFVQAHWNRAVAQLLDGNFEAGFRGYEYRKRHERYRHEFRTLPGPAWEAEALAGRTILVQAEQGLGDTIQLARYLPLLAARGARVLLACDKRLIPLLGTIPELAGIVAKDAPLPPYDLWIDQMSLPLRLGTRPDTIPAPLGYLRAEPDRVARWSARLGAGRKVGLVWAGNPLHSNDHRRSLPTDSLAALLAVDHVRFVNLQVGPRASEATTLAGVADLSAGLVDYAETAALVAALDLVVTVDTSVAHLAGALGRPVWVLLPYAPDWRWLLGRDDSPWYGSMRLFRQKRPSDWSDPVAEVRRRLREQRAA